MDQLVIEGRHTLKGTIRISGAKNAALPILAATLLTGGTFRLQNIPRLVDIRTFTDLLTDLGVIVDYSANNDSDVLSIDSSGLSDHEAPYDLVRKMRASILVLGPLMSRIGKARVSLPGGCAIGARPINLHLKGLELMGAKLRLKEGYIEARAGRLNGAHIYFDTPSVTGTENLMMAAVLAKGTTVLGNAAREPEVLALGRMLNQMEAKIKGLGSDTIKIEGVRKLRPELIIENILADHLEAVISKLRSTGLQIEGDNAGISVRKKGALHSVDITTLPYPGFPTDLQAQIMVLMALAGGLSVITETIFENRFMHVAELRRLGADIKVEGRSAIIKGVKGLNSAPVMATDLRASASLVLAGLAAKGTTIISRVYHLDRGYEHLEQKLAAVGAKIKRKKA
ncbi:MAG: UDP-N-acetylglucosamine 1-carboxyvinyltransferase [Deltaproteobacteria bacterium]|nr:UDP-N-acetylglucosamine 1-carboxyvinyltransferase [Deltaproteobacteria bacterium]